MHLAEYIGNPLFPQRFAASLMSALGVMALLLAAVGLYSVMAYAVSQRIHEIGIRLALGATRRDVFGLVMGHALRLVSIGTLLGLAGAWALTRLIAAQLYRTQATDPATFAAVAGLMTAVALGATYVPARRALKVDPAIALRGE